MKLQLLILGELSQGFLEDLQCLIMFDGAQVTVDAKVAYSPPHQDYGLNIHTGVNC
jgi:hypothetical protein